MADRVSASAGDHPPAGPFDVVIANILAGVLLRLAGPLVAATAPGGRLVLTGILREQTRDVAEGFAAQGMMLETAAELEDWALMTGSVP